MPGKCVGCGKKCQIGAPFSVCPSCRTIILKWVDANAEHKRLVNKIMGEKQRPFELDTRERLLNIEKTVEGLMNQIDEAHNKIDYHHFEEEIERAEKTLNDKTKED